MRSKIFLSPFFALLAMALTLPACRRTDPQVNSNAHPQGALDKNKQESTARPPPAVVDKSTIGTDSTGRPSDASGGTTGTDPKPPADAKPPQPAAKPKSP
jgi:hypothetical protein